jgi:hypothetical protein
LGNPSADGPFVFSQNSTLKNEKTKFRGVFLKGLLKKGSSKIEKQDFLKSKSDFYPSEVLKGPEHLRNFRVIQHRFEGVK